MNENMDSQYSNINNNHNEFPNLNFEQNNLGTVAPNWMEDSQTCSCLKCGVRFSIVKRRHHCRSCGKVFCSNCCEEVAPLPYLDNQEARVCIDCYNTISSSFLSTNSAISYYQINDGSSNESHNNLERSSTISLQNTSFELINQSLDCTPQNDTTLSAILINNPPIYSRLDMNENPPSYSRVNQMTNYDSPGLVQTLLNIFGVSSLPNQSINSINEAVSYQPDLQQNTDCHSTIRFSSANSQLPPLLVNKNMCMSIENIFYSELLSMKVQNLKTVGSDNFLSFLLNCSFVLKVYFSGSFNNNDRWIFITDGFGTVNADELKFIVQFNDNVDFIPIFKDIIEIFHNIYEIYKKDKKSNIFSFLKFNNELTFLNKIFDYSGLIFLRKPLDVFIDVSSNLYNYVYPILVKKDEESIARHVPLRYLQIFDSSLKEKNSCIFINDIHRSTTLNSTSVWDSVISLIGDIEKYSFGFIMNPGISMEIKSNTIVLKLNENYKRSIIKSVKLITDENSTMIPIASSINYKVKWLLKYTELNKKDSLPIVANFLENCVFNHEFTDDSNLNAIAPSFILFSYKNFQNEVNELKGQPILRASFIEDGLMFYLDQKDLKNIRNVMIGHVNSLEFDIKWNILHDLVLPNEFHGSSDKCIALMENLTNYGFSSFENKTISTSNLNKLIIKWSNTDYSRPPYPKFYQSSIDSHFYCRDSLLKIRHSHDFTLDDLKMPKKTDYLQCCRLIWTDVCFPDLSHSELMEMNRKSNGYHPSINKLMDKLGTVTASFSRTFMLEISKRLSLFYEMGFIDLSIRIDSLNETKDNINNFFKIGSCGSELLDQLFSFTDFPIVKKAAKSFARAIYLVGQHRVELFYRISPTTSTI